MSTQFIVLAVTLVIGVLVLMTILRLAKFTRGIVKSSRSGMVFSDQIWQWREGESISLTDLWPGASDMSAIFGNQLMPKIVPKRLLADTVGDVSYQVFRIQFEVPGLPMPATGLPSIVQIRLQFKKQFPGKLVVQRVDGPTIGPDRTLESIEFNKQTFVSAASAKIPYEIFSPDFMAWYLDVAEKPLLIFEGANCFCTMVQADISKNDAAKIVHQLLQHIRHSGALA